MSLHRNLDAVATAHGLTTVPNHEPSMWLRAKLQDLASRWAHGTFTTCGHRRKNYTAVLWAPDRLVCGDCAPSLTLTGDADHTCDRCAEVHERIHLHVCIYGGVLVAYGLCGACHRREVA